MNPCVTCGLSPDEHRGTERFCPTYATYRPEPHPQWKLVQAQGEAARKPGLTLAIRRDTEKA